MKPEYDEEASQLIDQRRRNNRNELIYSLAALTVCGAVIWMLVRHLAS